MHSLLVLVAFVASIAMATRLDTQSFVPPFDDYNTIGSRTIPKWRSGGDAEINVNFVRLTADRQSKKGWLWTEGKFLDTETGNSIEEFSAIFKFRISGQGKRLFGDGIALWLTQNRNFVPGNMHGFEDNFVGVSIVLDTFKNTENGQQHKDVGVMINDGSKDYDTMAANIEGCDANFRYHEERADFGVRNATRLKLAYERNGRLRVEVDPRNTGTWEPCTVINNVNLPRGWLKDAQFGISATTGGLADNHDVLSMMTFDKSTDADFYSTPAGDKALDALDNTADNEFSKKGLPDKMISLRERLDHLDHHLEHQLEAVEDHMNNMIGKLQKQEDGAEDRIKILEESLNSEVDKSLLERLKKLETEVEDRMDASLMKRIERLEDRFNQKIESSVQKGVDGASGSWRSPFFILLGIISLVVGGGYWKWNEMKKQHLL